MVDGRVERGQATRERVLEAGRALFGEHGYDATSIAAILERAGVTRGSLYHHFATKEDLFDAVLDREMADIATTVAKAATSTTDPLESLRLGCTAWLEMALDPAIQRIVLLDPPSVVGWTRLREIDEQHTLGGMRAGLQRIAADGRLPAGNVDVLAHMLIASVDEAALLIARADDPEQALVEGKAAFNLLLDRLVA